MNASFEGATLRNTGCSGAYMYLSSIKNAHIDNTDFEEADLTWSDITGANIASAKISGANLAWTVVDGSKLSENQFFSIAPNVLQTIKFLSAEGSTCKETSTSKPKAIYLFSGDNAKGLYGAQGIRLDYSPKANDMYAHKGLESYTSKNKKLGGYER
ncbi:MAG: pentapeptide repeat-containing protein [Candidatus Aenigmarchaeota archaeon]|nr:pentapeptide repeat-containing protein [Candidatus Aenigmarchaeota archaeon]